MGLAAVSRLVELDTCCISVSYSRPGYRPRAILDKPLEYVAYEMITKY